MVYYFPLPPSRIKTGHQIKEEKKQKNPKEAE